MSSTNNSPYLGGMPGGSVGFSPADFGDAEDLRPAAATFDIGGHGLSTPYSSAIAGLLSKHTDEIRNKTAANLPGQWRKRLREFISLRNNDLLDFLNVSLPSHPVLGPGELLLKRFGNPQVSATHPSVREIVLDASGVSADLTAEICASLDAVAAQDLSANSLKVFGAQARHLYDEYRAAGDAILKTQGALKTKLDRLDRVQGRVQTLFELETNEKWPALAEAMEAYVRGTFEENRIEADYKALVAAYRRFATVRDYVQIMRAGVAQEHEPLCSICLQETVSFALVPCGHTMCQKCVMRQSNNSSCFMCRATVRDRVKLYFG